MGGAICGLLAGLAMLFLPAPAEKRRQTRRMGIVYLGVGALNLVLATLII